VVAAASSSRRHNGSACGAHAGWPSARLSWGAREAQASGRGRAAGANDGSLRARWRGRHTAAAEETAWAATASARNRRSTRQAAAAGGRGGAGAALGAAGPGAGSSSASSGGHNSGPSGPYQTVGAGTLAGAAAAPRASKAARAAARAADATREDRRGGVAWAPLRGVAARGAKQPAGPRGDRGGDRGMGRGPATGEKAAREDVVSAKGAGAGSRRHPAAEGEEPVCVGGVRGEAGAAAGAPQTTRAAEEAAAESAATSAAGSAAPVAARTGRRADAGKPHGTAKPTKRGTVRRREPPTEGTNRTGAANRRDGGAERGRGAPLRHEGTCGSGKAGRRGGDGNKRAPPGTRERWSARRVGRATRGHAAGKVGGARAGEDGAPQWGPGTPTQPGGGAGAGMARRRG